MGPNRNRICIHEYEAFDGCSVLGLASHILLAVAYLNMVKGPGNNNEKYTVYVHLMCAYDHAFPLYGEGSIG
jgi:hypothetical protein